MWKNVVLYRFLYLCSILTSGYHSSPCFYIFINSFFSYHLKIFPKAEIFFPQCLSQKKRKNFHLWSVHMLTFFTSSLMSFHLFFYLPWALHVSMKRCLAYENTTGLSRTTRPNIGVFVLIFDVFSMLIPNKDMKCNISVPEF